MKAVLSLLVGLIILPLSSAAAEADAMSKESAARLARLMDGTGLPYLKHSAAAFVFAFTGKSSDSVAVILIADDRSAVVQGIIAEHDNVLDDMQVMKHLLQKNAGGSVNYMIDEGDNYVTRAVVLDYGKVTAAELKSTIQTVAAATDIAIGAVAAYLRTDAGKTGDPATPGPGTARAEVLGGKSWVEYDPAKWKENPSTEKSRRTFRHVNGDGYAMIISERLEAPLESLPTVALNNALLVSPDMKVIEQERRRVNGTEVFMMRMEGRLSGVPFTYLGYYYGGKGGTIQVITYTSQSLFAEFRKDFEAFLNGLQVHPLVESHE